MTTADEKIDGELLEGSGFTYADLQREIDWVCDLATSPDNQNFTVYFTTASAQRLAATMLVLAGKHAGGARNWLARNALTEALHRTALAGSTAPAPERRPETSSAAARAAAEVITKRISDGGGIRLDLAGWDRIRGIVQNSVLDLLNQPRAPS